MPEQMATLKEIEERSEKLRRTRTVGVYIEDYDLLIRAVRQLRGSYEAALRNIDHAIPDADVLELLNETD